MKKLIFVLIISFFLTVCIPFSVRAVPVEEQTQELYDGLPAETREILSSFGIDLSQDGELFDISFSRVFKTLAQVFSGSMKQPLSFTVRMLVMLAVVSLFKELAAGFEKIISLFCTLMCCAAALGGVSDCINALMSSAKICSDFLLVYVPVFALIVTFSGSAATALTYNSTVLAFSEIISRFSSVYMLPVCGILMSMGTAFSLNPVFNSSKLVAAVNKCITWVSRTVMSVFAAVLSLKGIMSTAADSLTSRGIKLMFSSLVPVIGGALSEAYSSIAGSLALARGSVAVLGIAAVFALNLPVLAESAMYGVSLSLLSFASDAAGQHGMSSVLGCMKCTVRLMSMLVIMQIFLTVISTGTVLLMRGNA
ncbi:MAG: hypothetical protein MJ177_09970 [Clostridia bacterium]|nr:hypothetical protein [Clostridia bacterium]